MFKCSNLASNFAFEEESLVNIPLEEHNGTVFTGEADVTSCLSTPTLQPQLLGQGIHPRRTTAPRLRFAGNIIADTLTLKDYQSIIIVQHI